MRRSFALLALLLGTGTSGNAFADSIEAPPTTDVEQAHAARDERSEPNETRQLNESAITHLRRERDEIHRGGPIALIVAGGVVGLLSIDLAQLHGLSGMGESSSQPSSSSLTGFYIASGVGFTAAVVGLFWLFDCNRRRGELEDRIERLQSRPETGTLLLPAFNPVTKSAELTLYRQF